MREAQFPKALTVGFQEEVYETIKDITDERRISMAEWVRDAVDTALNNLEEEEDTM